jgi:F-type H+-transporting ATPase subunit b
MQSYVTQFAASGSNGDILGALGIDVRVLVLQTVAFLILLFVLGKWVYPIFIKAIDDRQAAIEAGMKASQEAQKQAEVAEAKVAKELEEARKQADDILAATHKEANVMLTEAEEKAAKRATHIVDEAKADMQNQLESARRELKSETRKLVAEATEQIIGEKLDATKDAQLVDKAITKAKERA